tara:strand:- start:7 stop:177 length:171 start_codon:yes stop_codon:yes gene_type:complete
MDIEKSFWDIIDNEFGIYDVLDESASPLNNIFYTIINPTPGIIIMINEDLYGKEAW